MRFQEYHEALRDMVVEEYNQVVVEGTQTGKRIGGQMYQKQLLEDFVFSTRMMLVTTKYERLIERAPEQYQERIYRDFDTLRCDAMQTNDEELLEQAIEVYEVLNRAVERWNIRRLCSQ